MRTIVCAVQGIMSTDERNDEIIWPKSDGRGMWIIKNRILILELFDLHISLFYFNKAALLLK